MPRVGCRSCDEGALIVVDLGSDLRPEDFLNPGIHHRCRAEP